MINSVKVSAVSKLVLSISAFVLCASLFVFSINTVTANDTKAFNFPDKLTNKDMSAINSSGGAYRMELTTATYSDGSVSVYCMVYNTTTGKSKFYIIYGSNNIKPLPAKYQLPLSPL